MTKPKRLVDHGYRQKIQRVMLIEIRFEHISAKSFASDLLGTDHQTNMVDR
jgi:hypothetical protein